MTLTRTVSLLMLLLAASCTSPRAGNDDTDDPFVARDSAPDANRDSSRAPTESDVAPLTSEEEGDAALLVNELEQTDDNERDDVIDKLVALGPRYLEFLRSIESDVAAIDLMYVIRRIERAQSTDRPEEPAEDAAREGEDRPEEPQAGMDDELPDPPEYDLDHGEYDREAVERFLEVRLDQARRMVDRGQYDSAIRIADAALVLMPQSRLKPDFETLIRRARGESQADLLIAGTLSVSPDRLQYDAREKSSPFRETLQIRCFLKNVSTNEITLRINEGAERRSILQLAIEYDQLDFLGTAYNYRGNVSIPVEGDDAITLAPNESYSLTVPLEGLSSLDSDAPLKNALGRVEIDAALRVYGALDSDGDPLVLRPVQFPRRSVLLFPAGFDLAGAEGRGLNALRSALEDGKPQDLYMAAHLVGRDDRRAAGDALFKDYDRSIVAMQRARLASLSVIFDVGRTWEIRRWREWWDENRRRQ